MRHGTPRRRFRAPASAAVAALALLLTACGAGSSTAAVTPTATPTPTPPPATATPSPTPTASPSPTATVTPTATPAGAARRLAGPPPAPTPLPTPPPRQGAIPTNPGGIARMLAPGLIRDLYIEVVHVVNNQMQAPKDGEYSVGWYPEYGVPGSANNAVFAAHESWNHFQGPFYNLHLAEPGDPIEIVMANGATYHYQVISRHRYALSNIPMAEILWPTDRPPGQQWITLMTCGGTIIYNSTGYGEFLDRDVIVAKRVS